MIKFLSVALSWACLASASAAGTPNAIRVFRGAKQANLSPAAFHQTLNQTFIPALATTHAKNGAVGYLPVLPPSSKPASVSDEYALVVYESAKANQIARATPEGQAYADSHWTLFDRERSKSGTAEPLGDEIVSETPYDVLQQPVDWQAGHSTFFLGARQQGVDPKRFLAGLREHVDQVVRAFGPSGLDGYVLVANEETEAAFQHWTDAEAAQRAFASPTGQAIGADALKILDPLQFSVAKPFDSRAGLRPNEAATVRFLRRAELDRTLASGETARLLRQIPTVKKWAVERDANGTPMVVIRITHWSDPNEIRARVLEKLPALVHYPIDMRLVEPGLL